MKPCAVLFDLDDTLYERSLPFREALEEFGISLPPDGVDRLYSCCKKRCDEVFHACQRGEITPEAMTIHRYCMGFSDMGLSITAEEAPVLQALYEARQRRITLSEQTTEMLNFCKREYGRLGIITNGGGSHQRAKINALGLTRWVDPELILISGEVGILKPDLRIFRIAEQRAGFPPEALLFVGDSPENDIAPAARAGWQTRLIDMRDASTYGELLPRNGRDTKCVSV